MLNELLEGLFETNYEPPALSSLDELIAEVCQRHDVTAAAQTGPGGQRQYARIRAEITNLATTSGVASIADIAQRFNCSQVTVLRTLRHYHPWQ